MMKAKNRTRKAPKFSVKSLHDTIEGCIVARSPKRLEVLLRGIGAYPGVIAGKILANVASLCNADDPAVRSVMNNNIASVVGDAWPVYVASVSRS